MSWMHLKIQGPPAPTTQHTSELSVFLGFSCDVVLLPVPLKGKFVPKEILASANDIMSSQNDSTRNSFRKAKLLLLQKLVGIL